MIIAHKLLCFEYSNISLTFSTITQVAFSQKYKKYSYTHIFIINKNFLISF